MPTPVQIARALSIVGHPFATMAAFSAVAGARGGMARTTVLVAVAIVVPVAALVTRQRRAGAWRTVDASDRRERPVLFLVLGAAAAVALGVVGVLGYVPVARVLAVVVGMVAVAGIANRWTKLSLHVAFEAFAATALVLLGSRWGWAFAAFAPALGWSRLELRRHTAAEVLLGAAVGIAAGLLAAG